MNLSPEKMLNATLGFIYRNLIEAPSYHLYLEAFLVLWVFWLLRKRKRSEKNKQLTLEEEQQIINAWRPRPLVDPEKESMVPMYENSTLWGNVVGRPGKFLEVDGDGNKYLNMATHNYLGLVDNKELDDEAEQCIRRYGVGACGPRGFYGTVDVHLQLEDKIAEFLDLEETALYSYGFAAVSSAIPSYAKAGDIIFADEFVSYPIQRGLQASRSKVHYFKHNSWEDFKLKLDEQVITDTKNTKKARAVRRFCVVEGIYTKTGDMSPLKEIADLCKKYKIRLIVDETVSFGTIGKTGRGLTEHLGVSVKDIDFITGSLEHGLASFGGFVVGSSFVVDHQRISGLGYCFSASLPPLLAGTGIRALSIVEENPGIVQELQEKSKFLQKVLEEKLTFFYLTCHELSPLKYLYLVNSHVFPRDVTINLLEQIIIYVKENYKIALVQPTYLHDEHILPLPSIRISMNRLFTHDEIEQVGIAIEEACMHLNIFDSLISNTEDEDTRNRMIEAYEKWRNEVDSTSNGALEDGNEDPGASGDHVKTNKTKKDS